MEAGGGAPPLLLPLRRSLTLREIVVLLVEVGVGRRPCAVEQRVQLVQLLERFSELRHRALTARRKEENPPPPK